MSRSEQGLRRAMPVVVGLFGSCFMLGAPSCTASSPDPRPTSSTGAGLVESKPVDEDEADRVVDPPPANPKDAAPAKDAGSAPDGASGCVVVPEFTSPSAACNACLQASCCQEINACMNSADCKELFGCRVFCTYDGCEADCDAKWPAQVASFEAMVQCTKTSCASAC